MVYKNLRCSIAIHEDFSLGIFFELHCRPTDVHSGSLQDWMSTSTDLCHVGHRCWSASSVFAIAVARVSGRIGRRLPWQRMRKQMHQAFVERLKSRRVN
jgi:hypothetical protein